MAIQNFPAALQPIIQQGVLEHKFNQALTSQIGYRNVADVEIFTANVGETITKTRAGLIAPATTPLNAAMTNSNFDNGLSPSNWTVEQYTLFANQYGLTLDLNIVTQRVGLNNRFAQNAYALGVNAAQTLDRLARDALYAPYFGGQTRVRTTLGGANVTISVDDIRGFQFVYNTAGFTSAAQLLAGGASAPTSAPVSASNPLLVTVGANAYTLVAATADAANVSTAPNGISGILTFSVAVTVADGTAGLGVQASNGSIIRRPSGRTNTSALQATDLLTMSVLLDAVADLRNNAVPDIDGAFNCYLDPKSARQLFADPDFRQLFQSATSANDVFRKGLVSDMLGLRFMPTTEVYVQPHPTLANAFVRRPIIVGQGALVEGRPDFLGEDRDGGILNAIVQYEDGIAHITRAPMDRLQQIVAQSWNSVISFCAPSDITTNNTIIPTASNASYKRAVMIEHVG